MVKSIARGDPGQRLGNTAIGVPVEVIRDLCPELRLPAGCPYRGLDPFTEEHVDYYYGREHATSQLLASLAARDFVPVVAVSGGGKSSLLQAGLAKGLRDRPVVGLAAADPLLPAGQQPAARRTAPEPGPARDTPSPGAGRGPCSGAGRGDSRRRSSRRTDRGGRPVRAALHRLRGRRAEAVRRAVAAAWPPTR